MDHQRSFLVIWDFHFALRAIRYIQLAPSHCNAPAQFSKRHNQATKKIRPYSTAVCGQLIS